MKALKSRTHMLPGDADLNDVFQDIQLLVGDYREQRLNIIILLSVHSGGGGGGGMELDDFGGICDEQSMLFTGDAITCELVG